MGKGQKSCNKCGATTGPRAYMCPKCNTPFIFKHKSREDTNTRIIHKFNWRELVAGDKIKVTGGPYYVDNTQQFIPMGHRGKFIVEKIDDNGIFAWATGNKKGGFSYIYMGKDYQDKETGIWKTKHKLLKLKQKEVLK